MSKPETADMTAGELAAILLRHPDLPVMVVSDDYSRSDVTGAQLTRERMGPGQPLTPTAFTLSVGRPDWED